MTFRERVTQEHPDAVDNYCMGGVSGCPYSYGYESVNKSPCKNSESNVPSEGFCCKCWDREIPDTNSNDCITTANEKEKNMATKKTKAELMEELENVKNAKAELEKELKNLDKYKQYEDCADETKALHTAFVNSGFSDAQAFELMKMFIQTAFSQEFTKAVLRR